MIKSSLPFDYFSAFPTVAIIHLIIEFTHLSATIFAFIFFFAQILSKKQYSKGILKMNPLKKKKY